MLEHLVEIQWLIGLLLGILLLALVARGRVYREYPLFAAYLAFDILTALTIKIFRESLFNYYVVTPKELLVNSLALALAFSQADRIFRHYRGLRRSIKTLLFLLLLVSLAYCLYLPGIFSSLEAFWYNIYMQLQPRLASSGALLFLIIAMGIRYYNLKVQRADKLIILGFLVYLGPIALGYVFLERYLEPVRHLFNAFYMGTYLVALVIWITIYWPSHDTLGLSGSRDP